VGILWGYRPGRPGRFAVPASRHSGHIGAATYTGWAGYWPSAFGPFAKPMNEIPRVVFSNSLTSADWGETTIATGDLAEAVTRLKQERGDGYLLAHGGHGSPDRWSRPA
jgi:dihydrofolate reductase